MERVTGKVALISGGARGATDATAHELPIVPN
jgi:hypothetical protein